MIWVAIDAAACFNQKLLRASDGAFRLWVCGLMHCQQYLTDGCIPREMLPFLGTRGDVDALAEELVALGLWERGDDGFRVHDYLDYQQSREQVESKKEHIRSIRRAAAKQRWSKRDARAEQTESKPDANAMQNDAYTSTSTSTRKEEETHATKNGDERKAPKGHRGHFFCGDRLCVPQFLWEEFDRQLGGADMVKAQQWMRQLDQRLVHSGEVIEDPLKFVRDAFREALKGSKRHGYVHVETGNLLDTCVHVPHCTSSRACQTLRDLEAIKEQVRHEGSTDPSVGRPLESASVETGRSYSLRHPDAGGVGRT